MASILDQLPTYPLGSGIPPTNQTYVHVGPQRPLGWPVLFNETQILIVQDEAAAQGISRLINTVANFLAHGMLTQDELGFIIGIDAAWDLEQSLRHVGVHLTEKDLERH